MVDANGLTVLSPILMRPNAFGVVGALGNWFGDRAARRRAVRVWERAGPLHAIRDTPEIPGPMARVRGRVRTLRMVRAPDGSIVAAFRARRRVDSRSSSPSQPIPAGSGARYWIEEGTVCGAFLIDDGSGLALVDDDAIDIQAIDVDPLPLAEDGTLAIAEGDLAEVIGPATWAPPPPEHAGGPLVGSEPILRFDGRPDARLLLLPLPLTAVMPIPRSKWVQPSAPRGPSTLEHDNLSELEAAARGEAEARGRVTRGE